MTKSQPFLLARVFCSKQVTLDAVVARIREYYATIPIEIGIDGEVATLERPGLVVRIERIEKLRAFLAEAKALGWESAQARAKLRSCVLRIQMEVAPSYDGNMLTTGRPDTPDIPDEAVGLVEFLSVAPGIDLDVFDQITRHWLRDPR